MQRRGPLRFLALLLAVMAVSVACAQPQADREPAPAPSPVSPTHSALSPIPSPRSAIAIPTPRAGATASWQRAVGLFEDASDLQFEGRFAEAVETYQRSIEAFPTAEAHTFLGWTYSLMGQSQLAIAEGRKAIKLDPDLGNPYNDIGAYLQGMGRLDEAIPWLEKAMTARRYASPHYPHLNLGAIWVSKGLWSDAVAAFEEALRLEPRYPLPQVSSVGVFVPGLPQESDDSDDDGRLFAVRDAMTRYFQAWNAYDAEALLEASVPATVEETQAVLMHLAYTRLHGVQIALTDVNALYLGDRLAVLDTRLDIGDIPLPAYFLLAQEDGTWRVVGRATLLDAEPEGVSGPAGIRLQDTRIRRPVEAGPPLLFALTRLSILG